MGANWHGRFGGREPLRNERAESPESPPLLIGILAEEINTEAAIPLDRSAKIANKTRLLSKRRRKLWVTARTNF
jgi:hypothetical protein